MKKRLPLLTGIAAATGIWWSACATPNTVYATTITVYQDYWEAWIRTAATLLFLAILLTSALNLGLLVTEKIITTTPLKKIRSPVATNSLKTLYAFSSPRQ